MRSDSQKAQNSHWNLSESQIIHMIRMRLKLSVYLEKAGELVEFFWAMSIMGVHLVSLVVSWGFGLEGYEF